MKLNAPVFVAVVAAVAAHPVWAQKSDYVRISGSIDTVVRRDAGATAGPTWSVGPGGARASRLTFSVKEWVSERLAVTAVLEAGFAPDTGMGANNPPGASGGGLNFGRTSHVGLGSEQAGYVTLGRQYTPMQSVAASPNNDPFGGAWLGGIATIYNKNTLVSNAIAYTYGYGAEALLRAAPRQGLGFAALYGVGEQAAPMGGAGNQYGFNASYGRGPWWFGYAYHRQRGNSAAINPNAAASLGPVQTHQYAGGAWDFGWVRMHAGLNIGKNDVTTLDRHNWHLAFTAPAGDRGTIRALYGRADDRSAVDADFRTLQLAYQHDLSKRTALYAVWGQVNNGAISAASLQGFVGTAARGATVSSLAVGLRHVF